MKTAGFGRYLRLQLKRSGRLLSIVLLVTGLLSVSIGLLAAMIFDLDASGEQKQRLNIGIVGDPEDSYLNLGIYALQNLDSSRFSISFQRVELSQAESMLKTGSLNAYLCIPDDFVESVSRGENKSITYVTTDGALGLGSMIADEVVGSVSDLLLESQNAIFGMQRYGAAHGVETDLSQAGDQLSQRYLEAVLNRENLYVLEVVGVSDQLSLMGYYLCGLSILFLLLWGIGGSPLFVSRDLSLSRVLKSKGLGAFAQVGAEYLAWLALMAASLFCVGTLAAVFLTLSGLSIQELQGIGDLLSFMRSLLPVAAMLSAMQLLLYELVSGTINCILVQFFMAASLGYLSGCFYPIQFFPAGIQQLAGYLPTGVGRNYLAACLSGSAALKQLFQVLFYFLLFFSLTVLLRHRRSCR